MLNKIVLTGASGRLGSYLREPLSKLCKILISTDVNDDIGALNDNEQFILADLSKFEEINPVMIGANVICHFGAIVDEKPFNQLLGPNFIRSYNVWETAKLNNVKRVIYASSIHAVGMYSNSIKLTPFVPHRPDTYYGLSKCFSEDLARMYYEKNQIETACLRIASCAPVTTKRGLASWLSYNDLILLVKAAIEAKFIGFSILYGVSNNTRKKIDNSESKHVGFKPKDNAEVYAKKILKKDLSEEISDPGNKCHGGPFASTELGISPIEKMNIINKKKED